MRRKPSTLCRSCSTAASRRNRAPLVLALLLAAAACPPASAQAIELSVDSGGGFLNANLTFRWNRPEEVLASLRRGLESRITFVTRLYETRSPAFAFAGDRILAEKRVTRSAFWDFLDQVYVVEQEGGGQKTYSDPLELLVGFFSLQQSFAYTAAGTDPGRLRYVAARAWFEPVRLMPPLTVVGLAGAAVNTTTPWVRRELP